MDASVATLTLVGLSPMTQSHRHDEPRLGKKEDHDEYDARTWRSKLNTDERGGKTTVVIPAFGVHMCFADAARYSKRQIPGQGKATWTAKFASGIMLEESPSLNVDPATVKCITISANSDGKRGSGSRVTRRLPIIPAGWTTTFDVIILDDLITGEVFREMVEIAGMYIGLGQFRPQNCGSNGRFKIGKLVWQDNRRLAA